MTDRKNEFTLEAKNRLAKLALSGAISAENEFSVNGEIHALQKNGEALDLVNMILRSSDDELIRQITKKGCLENGLGKQGVAQWIARLKTLSLIFLICWFASRHSDQSIK